MTSGRFTAALVALGLVVALASFAIGLAVFHDGADDPPPRALDDPVDTVPTPPPSSTTTAPPPVVITVDELETPAWIVVVASGSSQDTARATASSVAAEGHPAGVLRSDDYPSLAEGFWVAYSGPYPDRATAEDAERALAADGFDDAYVRCAGSKKDCGRADGDDD